MDDLWQLATCLSQLMGSNYHHNHLECVLHYNHKETQFEQKSEKNRLAEAAMFYEKKKPFGKIIFTLG